MDETEKESFTLDLNRKQLKKVPKQKDAQHVRTLLLDENELQKIENLDSFLKIEKLSISKNYLVRMYGICRLHHLRELNLSFNRILSIEGLKECIPLRYLNLEGNSIKNIEHLNSNINLEYLNLSDNAISSISDISFLRNLKELYLHGNTLTHLRLCDKYLPQSLEVLTLAKNNINDLNEICTLAHLNNLNSITINENPCVVMTAGGDGFDHRPFVLNWCMSLKVIDGFMVDPIESLKAEWLYSQGRGRSFRLGEQTALAKHLSAVCPLTGKALENENERKLRLILSKAQQHQRQLQEEISENISNNSQNSSPSSVRKKPASRIQSPRFSRLSGRQGSTESMVSSYHGNTVTEQLSQNTNIANPGSNVLMTTSLIENIKNMETTVQPEMAENSKLTISNQSSQETNTNNELPTSLILSTNGPLMAASKMVPVPETLMSPDICPSTVAQHIALSTINTQMGKSSHHQQPQIKCLKNRENLENCTNLNQSATCKRSPRRKAQSPNGEKRLAMVSDGKDNDNFNEKGKKYQPSSSFLSNNSILLTIHGDNVPLSDASDDDRKYKKVDEDDDDDDSDNINMDKLKTIRNKAAERNLKNNLKRMDCEDSAIIIQKNWRGYRTRKKNKIIAEELLKIRTNEYIDKLTKDMELTKIQLENERKIQQLQMQAINALWKKVSCMQNQPLTGDGNEGIADAQSISVVNDLNRTCSMLTTQVQQLQCSMRDILNCMSALCNFPPETTKRLLSSTLLDSTQQFYGATATQTEIVAVHTPQVEHFPYSSRMRPSSLPFAEVAASSVIRAVGDPEATIANNFVKSSGLNCSQKRTIEENDYEILHKSLSPPLSPSTHSAMNRNEINSQNLQLETANTSTNG